MRKHHSLFSFCYLTIFVLAWCYELGSGLTSYTIDIDSDRSVTIPAVCNATLRCQGGTVTQNGMTMQECNNSVAEITICNLMDGSSASFRCSNNATSSLVLNISVSQSAVIYTEENGTAEDVLHGRQQLPCTPVVSCNETSDASWNRSNFDSDTFTRVTDMISDNTLTVGTRQYGIYKCYAGGDTTGLVYYAYGGPRFTTPDEHHKVTVNQDAELFCSPSVHPAVTFRWFFDISNGSRVITTCRNQTEQITDRIRIDCSANHSTLIIEDTEYDDAGVYRCEASHDYNNSSKTFHLSIKSQLTPLWPAIGIILELSLMAIIILSHEYYQRRKQKKEKTPGSPFIDPPDTKDNNMEAYNFPSASNDRPTHDKRHRIGSITQQSLLPTQQ